jgi:ribosome recycling factor
MEAVKKGKFPEDETKRLEKDVQAATDKAIKDINDHFAAKEKDLLAV